jgi:hypothetical protein
MTQTEAVADFNVYQIGAIVDELSELYRTPDGREVLTANLAKVEAAYHRLATLVTLVQLEKAA